MSSELLFALHGLLGALLATLLWARSWRDLYSFEAFRNYAVGLIMGYLYHILHSEYSFPNAMMAVVFGYFGKDIAESLFEKLKRRHS